MAHSSRTFPPKGAFGRRLGPQRVAHGGVEEGCEGGVVAGAGHAVPERGGVEPQFAAGDVLGLEGVVLDREVLVLRAADHDRPGADRPQGGHQVPAVQSADVGVLPGPQLGQQVVGVPVVDVVAFPVDEQLLRRAESQRPIVPVAEELRRVRPAGVDPGERLEPGHRGSGPGGEVRVDQQRGLDPLEEHPVVHRCPRRGAHRHDRLDQVGIHGRPVVGLAAGHRPAGHQGDPRHPEVLEEQPVPGAHIVGQRHPGEPGAALRRGGVARRGGQPVAEHVDRHHEMPGRVDRAARAEEALVAPVGAGEEGGQHDDVVGRRVQLAVGAVGQSRGQQRLAAVQRDIAEFENRVVHRDLSTAAGTR